MTSDARDFLLESSCQLCRHLASHVELCLDSDGWRFICRGTAAGNGKGNIAAHIPAGRQSNAPLPASPTRPAKEPAAAGAGCSAQRRTHSCTPLPLSSTTSACSNRAKRRTSRGAPGRIWGLRSPTNTDLAPHSRAAGRARRERRTGRPRLAPFPRLSGKGDMADRTGTGIPQRHQLRLGCLPRRRSGRHARTSGSPKVTASA